MRVKLARMDTRSGPNAFSTNASDCFNSQWCGDHYARIRKIFHPANQSRFFQGFSCREPVLLPTVTALNTFQQRNLSILPSLSWDQFALLIAERLQQLGVMSLLFHMGLCPVLSMLLGVTSCLFSLPGRINVIHHSFLRTFIPTGLHHLSIRRSHLLRPPCRPHQTFSNVFSQEWHGALTAAIRR